MAVRGIVKGGALTRSPLLKTHIMSCRGICVPAMLEFKLLEQFATHPLW